MRNALYFALGAHGPQMYGKRPYLDHLREVQEIATQIMAGLIAESVLEIDGREQMRLASDVSMLHDTVEDTPATDEIIRQVFGDEVADGVAYCTDEEGPNRKARKAATYARVKEHPNKVGRVVKWADRLANLRNCHATKNHGLLRMYRREAQDFFDAYAPGEHSDAWAPWLDEYWRLVQ